MGFLVFLGAFGCLGAFFCVCDFAGLKNTGGSKTLLLHPRGLGDEGNATWSPYVLRNIDQQ